MSAEYTQLAREARAQAARLVDSAGKLHQAGWSRVLALAQDGGFAKYGIYASRTLAVPHPEVYLRADAVFWQMASTVRGFRDAYAIRKAADVYMMWWFRALEGGLPLGDPLHWADIPARAYSVVRSRAAYPDGYPFFGFLDQRLAPLAVSLKTSGDCISGLERAEQEYFRALADGAPRSALFLVLCDDESAYLADGERLVAMASLSSAAEVTGNPILIFNEDAVWYPLLGRDDTERQPELFELVRRLRRPIILPPLSPDEAGYVPLLRVAGELAGTRQVDMAMLAALRAGGLPGDLYTEIWQRSILAHDLCSHNVLSRKLGIIRECNHYAATLSPVAAYLAALVGTARDPQTGLSVLSGEYLKHVGVVRDDENGWKKPGRLEAWGHLWYCPLMEYTVDDSWRSGGGHCVSQSISLSAALDLAGVDHYVTHFNRGGLLSIDHHFVSSTDGEWVLDDAMLNFFASGTARTGDWGCLLSFSKDGQWASVVLGEYFGNIPPAAAAEHVARIEHLIGGRFPLQFLEMQRDELHSKADWLAYLATIQDWQPVTLP